MYQHWDSVSSLVSIVMFGCVMYTYMYMETVCIHACTWRLYTYMHVHGDCVHVFVSNTWHCMCWFSLLIALHNCVQCDMILAPRGHVIHEGNNNMYTCSVLFRNVSALNFLPSFFLQWWFVIFLREATYIVFSFQIVTFCICIFHLLSHLQNTKNWSVIG